MKISAIECHHYCLPLHAAWMTAGSSFAQRQGFLLRITTDDNRYGFGDCAPLTGVGNEALTVAEKTLRAYAPKITGMQVADALKALPAPSTTIPEARCALESALLDLLAQTDNVALARYLQDSKPSGRLSHEIVVNAALGSLMQVSEQAIVAACSDGFSVLKLKVGIGTPEQELARLQRITGLLPAGTQLRLDANRAWKTADAARFLKACADLPIEMVEEPLANPTIRALQGLQAACAFPLALDESLTDFDLEALCTAPPVRRLVLKPPRLGGLLPALNIARRATAAGMQCVVTSSIDSACGVLAAAHLAAALDNGLAHGLATSSWLAADTGMPPTISNGRLALPDIPGLGFVAYGTLDFSGMGSQPTKNCEPPRHKGHQETPS